MPSPFVGPAWIQPLSTDPKYLINRNDERRKLLARLTDYLETEVASARILITGDRGVGKSILTRAILTEFAHQNQQNVIAIILNARGVGYRKFLQEFARELASNVRPHAQRWKTPYVDVWLDELLLLANANQITASQLEGINRKYGVDASLSTPGFSPLLFQIGTKFVWDESRSTATSVQRTLVVTDDLVHDAIREMLVRLQKMDDPLTIAVFYDDLDQAFESREDSVIEGNIQQILELQPCLAIAHIRTEAMYPNIRRVIDKEFVIQSLPPSELLEMLKHRSTSIKKSDAREALKGSAVWTAFQQLAEVSENPLAFLRWSAALLSLWGVSPPSDWRDEKNLEVLVSEATPTGGIEAGLMSKLARLVDTCTLRSEKGCHWADLERGGSSINAPERPPFQTEELQQLRKIGLVVRCDRIAENPRYRLEPTMELLRPSVAEKLRAAK